MEDKNLQRGIHLFETGRYKDAITFLKEALAEDPESFTAKYLIASSYLNLDKLTKAEEMVLALQASAPANPETMFLKSRLRFQQDKDQEALTLIEDAIAMAPNDVDYFAMKANILMHLKKFEDALLFANKALHIDASHTHALNLRASILTKLDRKEEASQTVENILHDNPEDCYSHTNVGWVELENGNTKKALEHFKEALSLDPSFEYARQGMGKAIKSKNGIYAAYLKYAFWMAKKSTKNQWIFIIGLYLVYRFALKLLTNLGLTYLTIPLIVLYLLFALGSWFMEPLSNTILGFDTYGKYLLRSDERKSGATFGLLLLLAILSAVLFYVLGNEAFLIAAVTFLCLLLPFPRSFLLHSTTARDLVWAYSFIMLLLGLAGPFYLEGFVAGIAVFAMMVVYTWIGNFLETR